MDAKYLVYFCKGIESVFDSQVLELLYSLNRKNSFTKLFLYVGSINDHDRAELNQRKISDEICVITYKSYPNYPFFNSLIRHELKHLVKKYRDVLEHSIIHVRGELLAYHLAQVLPQRHITKIIPDIRGASKEEIQENTKFSLLQKYLKIWNNKRALAYLNNFKVLSAVSEALKNHLISNYHLNPDSIKVTPDLAGRGFILDDNLRKNTRKELNLADNDFLLVFSNGSTSEWQSWQDAEILTILADKGIKLLNLSRYAVIHENIINMFVEFKDMPAYLNAADAAVIWGKKRTVTEVRSPVKFSEYICCGLPVISNDSVKMIEEYLCKTSYGILLDNINELDTERLCDLKKLDRTEIGSFALNWLGTEKITDEYMKMYALV